MHEMILNELCLMHNHAFFKLSFIKLSLGPLNWCTLFGCKAFSSKNIPWALLWLAITTGGLFTNFIPSLPRRAEDNKVALHCSVYLLSNLEEKDGNMTTI